MRQRLTLAAVLAVMTAVSLMAAENLRIVPLVHDPQVLVSVEMSDAYTDEVKDTIASGLRVTFTYDVQLRMEVAGWVDRTVATVVVNVSDQYDNLTRRHSLSRTIDGRTDDAAVTEDEAVVKQWLTTLTRNMLVDNYRRARMDRVTDSLNDSMDGEEDGPSKLDRLADTGRNQEQQLAGMELRAQIQEALKQVSPELREAVILRDLEDMDYKDIAEVLGVPQGTVKSRISRGRSELAKLLKRIEGQVM